MAITQPKLTQLQTAITKFDDPIIELNAALTGTNTNDVGIILNRGSSGDNAGILWDRSAGKFVVVQTTADGDSSGDLTFTDHADFEAKAITADSITATTINSDNFSLPATDGTSGQVLYTDGAGNVAWGDYLASSLKGAANGVAELDAGAVPDAQISSTSVTQHAGALNPLLVHDNLAGFVSNEHVDHSTVSISGGTGLSGGGTITANRTLNLDINSLTADGTPDGASDYVATYDASAGTHKKVLLDNIGSGPSYEEGTFNPEIWDSTLATDASPPSYSAQNGYYTKIGRVVIFDLYVEIFSLGGLSVSDAVYVGGLPYNTLNTVGYSSVPSIWWRDIASGKSAGESILGYMLHGVDYITIEIDDGISSTSNLTVGEFGGSGGFRISGTYIAN